LRLDLVEFGFGSVEFVDLELMATEFMNWTLTTRDLFARKFVGVTIVSLKFVDRTLLNPDGEVLLGIVLSPGSIPLFLIQVSRL
jgi:hypothetical protein